MGKHLLSYKEGWQSEHLANFILSKFSFLAQPITISDDIGSDFFCTLFRIVDKKFLQPQNSFTIQIKSKKDVKKKKNLIEVNPDRANYLFNLEIPFFIGIADRENLTLTIYSGETLPHFQTYFGGFPPHGQPPDSKLFINLVDNLQDRSILEEKVDNKYYMKFPEVVKIPANFDYRKSGEELNELFDVCRLMQENLASKISKEYIFKIYKNNLVKTFAGPDSAQCFRINFFYRLVEVFYNFRWLCQNGRTVDFEEFKIYKELYSELLKIGPQPMDMSTLISEIEGLIKSRS
ncbi:hypothetical protein ACFL4V_00130 [Candidatus Latescibacterota bacterium]